MPKLNATEERCMLWMGGIVTTSNGKVENDAYLDNYPSPMALKNINGNRNGVTELVTMPG